MRREGLGLLLRCCLTLLGVRCNVMDVLQAMSSYLKVNHELSPERNDNTKVVRVRLRGWTGPR